MTETTARIRWEDIASPIDALASRGFVGKLERRSFIIYRPEFDGGQYRLLCLIGDRGGESLYADDPDELKRAAERWLAGFVSSLGAVFPDEPGRPSRAWHADWVPADRDSSGNAILRHKPTGGTYKILPAEEC